MCQVKVYSVSKPVYFILPLHLKVVLSTLFKLFGLKTFHSTKSLRISGNTFDIKMFKIIKSNDNCEIRPIINILSLIFIARCVCVMCLVGGVHPGS